MRLLTWSYIWPREILWQPHPQYYVTKDFWRLKRNFSLTMSAYYQICYTLGFDYMWQSFKRIQDFINTNPLTTIQNDWKENIWPPEYSLGILLSVYAAKSQTLSKIRQKQTFWLWQKEQKCSPSLFTTFSYYLFNDLDFDPLSSVIKPAWNLVNVFTPSSHDRYKLITISQHHHSHAQTYSGAISKAHERKCVAIAPSVTTICHQKAG